MKFIPAALAAILFSLTGCSASPGAAAVAAAPQPTVTVTATYEAKAATPASCLLALDEADKIIQISADTMRIVSDTFNHIVDMDWDAVGRDAEKINGQTEKLEDVEYPTYAAACRAEAGE